ncbi:hypothetical protein [Haladaptatus litoreus]|nr:hypothetical protein [Haladaptatus litoreus]
MVRVTAVVVHGWRRPDADDSNFLFTVSGSADCLLCFETSSVAVMIKKYQ